MKPFNFIGWLRTIQLLTGSLRFFLKIYYHKRIWPCKAIELQNLGINFLGLYLKHKRPFFFIEINLNSIAIPLISNLYWPFQLGCLQNQPGAKQWIIAPVLAAFFYH
jgi:isoprenylcysteine carboxyl methyltransferase (ICMT) family protein YpbQ